MNPKYRIEFTDYLGSSIEGTAEQLIANLVTEGRVRGAIRVTKLESPIDKAIRVQEKKELRLHVAHLESRIDILESLI